MSETDGKTPLAKKPLFWVAIAISVVVVGGFGWAFVSAAMDGWNGQRFIRCLEDEGAVLSADPDSGETVVAELGGGSFYVTRLSADMRAEEPEASLDPLVYGPVQVGNMVAAPIGNAFSDHESEVVSACK